MVLLTKGFRIACQAQWLISDWRCHIRTFVDTETPTSPEQRIPQENRPRKVKTHTQWFQTLQVNSPSGCNCSPECCCLLRRSWQGCGCSLIACLNKGLESGAAVSCKGWKETGREHDCYVNHLLSVSVNISCLYWSWSENNHPGTMKCSLVAGVGIGMGFLAFQALGIHSAAGMTE